MSHVQQGRNAPLWTTQDADLLFSKAIRDEEANRTKHVGNKASSNAGQLMQFPLFCNTVARVAALVKPSMEPIAALRWLLTRVGDRWNEAEGESPSASPNSRGRRKRGGDG